MNIYYHSFLLLFLIGFCACQKEKTEISHIFIIGWDGVQEKKLKNLLDEGKLPHLQKIVSEGQIGTLTALTGETATKVGWSQIFTGKDSGETGVLSNKNYGIIPKGLTIFEQLRGHPKWAKAKLSFIGGKIDNIGSRGAHLICINCKKRFPSTRLRTNYRQEDTQAPLMKGQKKRLFVQRMGEPFYHLPKILDHHFLSYDNPDLVLKKSLEIINGLSKEEKSFSFFHFGEPDESLHRHGIESSIYINSLMALDKRLGLQVDLIKKRLPNSLIILLSDHGTDSAGRNHNEAFYTFFASNKKIFKPKIDRLEVKDQLETFLGL